MSSNHICMNIILNLTLYICVLHVTKADVEEVSASGIASPNLMSGQRVGSLIYPQPLVLLKLWVPTLHMCTCSFSYEHQHGVLKAFLIATYVTIV